MRPQFTDKAKMALALAERAARNLKQSYVGTEHILFGLLRENTGVAATVLMENGVEMQEMERIDQRFDRAGKHGHAGGERRLFTQGGKGFGGSAPAGGTFSQ